MNRALRQLLIGLAIAGAAGLAGARAVPQEVAGSLPDAVLGGNSRLTYLGFKVYDASLWVAPAFSVAQFDRHAFALELSYLRAFTGASIAQRSVVEMRRQGGVSEVKLAQWQQKMLDVFPNVRRGDRLIGLHRPGVGAVFLLNGQPLATIADEEFSRHFFGIWLSAQTSDLQLRRALVSQLPGRG
jgi:hypothetical protein